MREAFGLTTNDEPYVNLSDGGHFENLGLYEMVLRRCRFILLLDAGSDPEWTYQDLGNAIRKIRIDLKIPVQFEDEAMAGLRAKTKRCAIATLQYSKVDGTDPQGDGHLIFIKPMHLGNEPPDVEAYAGANPDFPHQSTSNQWFDESQTESYRMLGLHTIEEICEGWQGGDPESFVKHIKRVYLSEQPSAPEPD